MQEKKKRVAFVTSFLPRKCGIATFTSDLITNCKLAAGDGFEPLVVAMRADGDLKYDNPVKFEIRQNVKKDYICAADFLNFSRVDLVSVQHEFGLFGGEAGSYLNLLLNRLNAPIISTLHTVLNKPAADYLKSAVELCRISEKIITMNERGVSMLRDIYGVAESKIRLIPHGIPDLPFVDNNYYKHKFGMEGRRTVLTFGLLSRNKGIELMLKAMSKIVQANPSVLYVVLGMTHPEVLKFEGEAYRYSLQRKVKELGLENNVIFHNRFVNDEELQSFLCAADLYVTPYMNEEQLTSGTLSFAVGTGKAVVSTPYWAAAELLADGRGKLVPFGDSEKLADTIIEIIENDKLFYSLRRRAYDYGRSRTWPQIGKAYWKLFGAEKLKIPAGVQRKSATLQNGRAGVELPEPSLVHLRRITDDVGILQHAKFTIPDRDYGYCTDDNARAVIVMSKYYRQYPEPDILTLLDRYLAFIMHAQRPDGTVRNFMGYDRSWHEDEPVHDSLGRALWALGRIMADPPLPAYIPILKDCFDRSVGHVNKNEHPRSKAYSILGMEDYLLQFPGASEIKREMTEAADSLLEVYHRNSSEDWQWFQHSLTYDNAVLPHALFIAAERFGEQYVDAAMQTCNFLIDSTFDGNHFSFAGCKGWYRKGRTKAQWDQQPIEISSTVLMLQAAYKYTKNIRYLNLQRRAFDWMMGANDCGIPLYNFRTKGCHDGLENGSVNANQGAESLLSFLLGLLTVAESEAMADNGNAVSRNEVKVTEPKNLRMEVSSISAIAKPTVQPKLGEIRGVNSD